MSRRPRRAGTGNPGGRRDRATLVEAGRAALGLAHLIGSTPRALRARRATETVATSGRTDAVAPFERILGARQIVQAALLLRAGSPEAHMLGAAVDLVHAVSMLPLLLVDRRRRRFAAQQLGVATLLGVIEIGLVGTGGRRR